MTKENKLLIIFGFTFFLMALEVFGGLWSRSLALLSDAGHMFTDSLALLLSFIALHWSKKEPTESKTFGYHRLEIIIALVNGLILLGVSVYIFYEAIHRFIHPAVIKPDIMLAIAVIGLIGNIVGMLILNSERGDNLNVRSVFLHILGDTLSSVGVILGGLIILFTGWALVDSLLGLMIGGVVLRSTINLIFESGEILLEAAPRDINIDLLRTKVESIPGVREFHEIHVWSITSGRRALSAHVLLENVSVRDSQKTLAVVRDMLTRQFNIRHATLEVECDECENICVKELKELNTKV